MMSSIPKDEKEALQALEKSTPRVTRVLDLTVHHCWTRVFKEALFQVLLIL